ncbi:MAG TPA: peptidase, partial [Vicinamibacteria bacterium]|nr:peptidase [Vicinamibacteria bacterium]
PHIRRFIEAGGEVLTIGSATRLAYMLDLPLKNALVERTASGEERPLPSEKYYIPGSLLEVAVDTAASIAWGSPRTVDVMFDESPAFRLDADAAAKGLRAVAWYDSPTPLRSGWAWGQEHLNGAAAIVEARLGQGTVYLFGPEILFRSQPHGTFRFFFNALLDPSRSPAPPVP